MGNVVWDADEARAPTGKDVLGSPGRHLRCVDLAIPTLLERPRFVKRQRPVGEAVRDVVDSRGFEPGRLQAVEDRVARKRPRGFLTGETLLGDRRGDIVVRDERGSRVEALGDPVLPRIEIGQFSPLECDAVVEPADTDDVHVTLDSKCTHTATDGNPVVTRRSVPETRLEDEDPAATPRSCLSALGDRHLLIHSKLLVPWNGTVELVRAGLQLHGQRLALAGGDLGGALLHAASLHDEVVRDLALVLDLEGVLARLEL